MGKFALACENLLYDTGLCYHITAFLCDMLGRCDAQSGKGWELRCGYPGGIPCVLWFH